MGAIIGLSLAILPLGASAQVVSQTDLDLFKSQIIALLTQEIAALQAQIDQILQAQANQTQLNIATPTTMEVTQPIVTVPTVPLKLGRTIIGTGLTAYLSGEGDSLADVTSNKPIDVTRTELWVDGIQRTITVSNPQVINSNRVRFTISPNIYSFASISPNRIETNVRMVFYSGDESASTVENDCVAEKTPDNHWWSTTCRDGDLPVD